MSFKEKTKRVIGIYFIMMISTIFKKDLIVMSIRIQNNFRGHRAGNGRKYPFSKFFLSSYYMPQNRKIIVL